MAIEDLSQVHHPTLETRVYREILQAILSGKLSPGTSVTITELAQRLGVSLMPVRQALKSLEAKNLIHVLKNRRLVVRRLSVTDLEELFAVRLQLEESAVRAAVAGCSEETIQELERLLEEMSTCQDRELYLEMNRAFHHTIYRCAGKPILLEIIEDLWHRVSPYMHLYLQIDVTGHHSSHSGLLEGLRAWDAEEAAHWLRVDMQRAAQELAKRLTPHEQQRDPQQAPAPTNRGSAS
jgi:DNA-binding GntR family transcriptional regulator